MPVELLPPANGAVWLENWVLVATVADVTSERAVTHPAKNLLSPHRSAAWRSAELAAVFARVTFDLGQTRLPACFALVGSNLDGGFRVQLRGSDDASGVSNIVWWDLPLYQQDPVGKTLRWYLGDSSGGSPGSGRRFWGVWILPGAFGSYNTGEDYYEIGVIWLGTYEPATIASVASTARSETFRARTSASAKWSDVQQTFEELDVALTPTSRSAYYTLKAKLSQQGNAHALLDLHAREIDPIVKAGGSYYGMLSQRPYSGRLRSPQANDLAFRLDESRG